MYRYAIVLFCPFLSGCAAVAYPWVTQTPALASLEPDVKAFRVNEDGSFFGAITVPYGTCVPQEIARGSGNIPAHTDLDVFYGFMIFPVAGYNIHAHSIRLYRRGYETIVIEARPWLAAVALNGEPKLTWKKAATLEARAAAIDAIYHSDRFHGPTPQNEFIAEEYRILAESPLAAGPDNTETRERLLGLAKSSREGPGK